MSISQVDMCCICVLCIIVDPIMLEMTVQNLEEMQDIFHVNQEQLQHSQTKIIHRLDDVSNRLLKLERDYQRITTTSSSWDVNLSPMNHQYHSTYPVPMHTYPRYNAVHVRDYPAHHSSNRPSSPTHLPSFPMDPQPTHSFGPNEQVSMPKAISNAPHTPQCLPLQGTSNKVTVLPSEAINKAALLPADDILKKYSKLKGASRAGELAVKLAMEAFFGEQVLTMCTVKGCRNLPALPSAELQQLKQVVFTQVPQFWSNPADFDQDVWASCIVSINQKCKGLRSQKQKKNEE